MAGIPSSTRRATAALAVSLSLGLGCADDGGAEDDSADESATETDTGEPDYVPELLDRNCPFSSPPGRSADCYTLLVPLDRERLDLGAVQIPVAVLHPAGAPTRPPTLYFHGGPGGQTFSSGAYWFTRLPSQDGDFILFDQRGGGESVPNLDCDEVEDGWLEAFTTVTDPAAEIAILTAAYTDCRARLGQETELELFNTVANAQDVEDLRAALGIDEWSLYGISYGTRIALEVMRRDPEPVTSVVLDSVYPPQVGGVSWMAGSARTGVQRLIQGCADEEFCAASFPDLGENLETALINLDVEPYVTTVQDLQGVDRELSVSSADLYAGLYNALYDAELIPLIPLLIFQAAQGNYGFLDQLAAESLPLLTALSEGARLSYDCVDGGALIDAAELDAAISADPEFSTLFAAYALPHCETWGVESTPAEAIEPVVSDIPTLILAGEYDPVTPASQSQQAAETLSAGEVYEFPGMGHAVSQASSCAEAMTQEFLITGAADSSCWSALDPVTF